MSKPAPFKRPSIDLGRHGRSWKLVEAKTLQVQDIIRDRGVVTSVDTYEDAVLNLSNGESYRIEEVHVHYISGQTDSFDTDELVYAFVRPSYEDARS